MKANVGAADKSIRFILALVFFSLYFLLEGDQKWFSLIGFVPLATGLLSWCPLYSIFGIKTCKI